jgi:hypothetical protein
MIFQSELSNLDSELSQLQALLSAKQQQRNLYNQLQQQTEGYLVGLAKLKDQIAETVGGGALASLKSAVLNLFDPGDHGEFGGNEPTTPTPDDSPAPEADQEDDDFDIIALNGETGDCLTTDDLDDIDDAGTAKLTYAQAIKRRCGACWGYEVTSKADVKAGFINRANLNFMEAVNLERSGQEFYKTVEAYLDRLYYNGQTCDIDKAPLTGQSCDWASPFASALTCLIWEDAPLLGQHCTIPFSATEDKGTQSGEHMPYVEFVEVSNKVGYLKVVHSGEIKSVYAGFSRKDRAEAWGRLLAVTYDIASGFEVRPAKHLPFKWELKLWDMKIAQIQKLAAEDLTKSPRVEVNSAKPPAREPVILDSDRVVVGQRIKIKDGQILEISSTLSADNRFFAKNANEQRQLIELDNVAEFLTESPAQAAGIEPPTGWRQVQPQEASEPEQSEPEQVELPIYQRSDGGFQVEQSIKESASILQVGDVVEITGDRHPQHFGLVGTVESLNHFSELPIGVRTPRGLKGYLRSDLKFVSKGDKPQSQGLQSGQLLTGNRVITSGRYVGEARVSRLLNAQLGTADKIATIQLAKDLKNLGFDPRLAVTVMAGEDDASDF